jgi:hypothetical protein
MGKLWIILTHLHNLAGYAQFRLIIIIISFLLPVVLCCEQISSPFLLLAALRSRSCTPCKLTRKHLFFILAQKHYSIWLRNQIQPVVLFGAAAQVRVGAGDGEPVEAGRRAVARLLDPLLLRHPRGDGPRVPYLLVISSGLVLPIR